MKTITSKISFLATIFVLFAVFTNSEAATHDLSYYKSIFDNTYAAYKGEFDSMAASGDGDTYYTFSYVLDGTISMFEATKDTKYLEQALSWAETMVSKATIIDSNGNKNWKGVWQSPYSPTPISYQLDDLQGSTELARLARIVWTDPNLKVKYWGRAQPVYEFVRNEIIEKWLWKRNALPWFIDTVKDRTKQMYDKPFLLIRLLNDVYVISGSSRYGTVLVSLADDIKNRFTPFGDGAIIWDLGLPSPYEDIHVQDTSHANRGPYAVVELYKSNISFTLSYVTGLANLLTRVIWDGSYDSPRFTNFIDGTNGDFRGRGPYGVGQIYSGWITLGEFDSKVQEVGAAVLDAIMAGKRNPSLDYMNHQFGKIELAGHLAKNLVLSSTPPSADTIPPSAPSDLKATAIFSSQVILSWTASTDNVGVAGYKIYRNGTQIATTTSTSYTDSNLSPSTTYTYSVSAYDAAGNESAKSNTVTVTTPSNSSINNITVRAKGSYAGGAWPNMEVWVNGSKINSIIVNSSTYTDYFFSFNSGTIDTVDIVFTNDYYNSSTGEDRNLWVDYIIVNNNKYEAESVYAIIDKGSGSAAFDGLNVIPGQEGIFWNGALRFRLSASQPLDTLSPSAPSNLRATSVTSNTVTLSWTASTDNIGVAGYKIYRNGVQVSITTSTSYKDTGLTPSTSYTYNVKAYDSSGNISQSSNSVLVKTTSNKWSRKWNQ